MTLINDYFTYIIMTVITLILLFLLFVFIRSKGKTRKLSPIAGVGFAFIIAGIVFGESRNIGYPLIGIGIILAVADVMNKTRKEDIEE